MEPLSFHSSSNKKGKKKSRVSWNLQLLVPDRKEDLLGHFGIYIGKDLIDAY